MSGEPPYPPLQSIEVVAVHGNNLPRGSFWACAYPERPWDPKWTWHDWRCRACVRHAQATLFNGVDPTLRWAFNAEEPSDSPQRIETRMSWLVARAVYWMGL